MVSSRCQTSHSCFPQGSLYVHRIIKWTKVYGNLEDTQPTIQNKPSGLKSNWHCLVLASVLHTHSHSSSSLLIAMLSAVPWSLVPGPDHRSLLLAISPPSFTRLSAPTIYGNLTPPIDRKPAVYLGHPSMVGSYLPLLFHMTHCSPTSPSCCHELIRIPGVKSYSPG